MFYAWGLVELEPREYNCGLRYLTVSCMSITHGVGDVILSHELLLYTILLLILHHDHDRHGPGSLTRMHCCETSVDVRLRKGCGS